MGRVEKAGAAGATGGARVLGLKCSFWFWKCRQYSFFRSVGFKV